MAYFGFRTLEPIMSRTAFIFTSLLAGIVLIMLSGCADPRHRQQVTGEVSFKGQAVEDGIINFAPIDGQETGEGAQIVKGKYRIPREKGLSPGKYTVRIYAGNGQSGAGDASPDSPNAGQRQSRERIPPAYNDQSTVIKEVTKGGPNNFDFNIP
jgi:hypothetical protein